MPAQCLTKFGKIIKTIKNIFDVVSQCLHDANTMPTRCAPEKIFNLTMRIVLTIFSQCPHDAYTMPT